MKYLSGYTNFASLEEVQKRYAGFTFNEYVVLEQHKDGTCAVVQLQDKPVQKGQVPYTG
jgi:hypothetical protein